MKLNHGQQDFLSGKLGDFGNVVGTGSLLASFFTEKVGILEDLLFVLYVICLQLI
jgi:hypothetical protein